MPRIVLLSSSLLLDRALLYTPLLAALEREADVEIWAGSAANPAAQPVWERAGIRVRPLPVVEPFPEFPHNYLRRLNEFAWDYAQQIPSRMSMMRLVRDKSRAWWVQCLKPAGYALGRLGLEERFEQWLERLLMGRRRSDEARRWLLETRPDLIVTTAPFFYSEPPIMAEARKLGIPTMAFISSWDNITTKARMVFEYDSFALWSPQMERELTEYYPYTRHKRRYIAGAFQYDLFFDPRFSISRTEFCSLYGLDARKPILVYALGSPNLLHEHYGALEMAERVVRGEIGDAQMIVRLHPIQDYARIGREFDRFAPRVVVQRPAQEGVPRVNRTDDFDQVLTWVNTFRHADVVINTASTVIVDAALFDHPVVNLTFDAEPGRPNQKLTEEVNFLWNHMKPVAGSGGVWNAASIEEAVTAVNTYLERPELHRERRRWITEYVCGYVDGQSSARMAEAMLDFAGIRRSHPLVQEHPVRG